MEGEKLKNIRKRSGLSQTELAALLGVSASLVSRMETGKRGIKPEEERKILELPGAEGYAPGHTGGNTEENTEGNAGGKEGTGEYTAYTDGGCAYNPGGPGGIGAVILDDGGKVIKEISKGYGPTSNNRMEICAAIEALKAVPEGSRVILYSDSQYLVNSMKGIFRMRKNNDLWGVLLSLDAKRTVEYRWVRGHNGNKYNERCDRLATEAMQSGSRDHDRSRGGKTAGAAGRGHGGTHRGTARDSGGKLPVIKKGRG